MRPFWENKTWLSKNHKKYYFLAQKIKTYITYVGN